MNNYIQVALGIVPALIFIILYLVLKKKQKFKCIVIAICFGIVFALCLFKGITSLIINNKSQLTEQNRLSIAYKLALNDSDLTDTAINELIKTNNYTEDLSLFNARKNALEGDYKAAKVLYEKTLRENYDSEVYSEYELTLAAYNTIYAIEDLENLENTDDDADEDSSTNDSITDDNESEVNNNDTQSDEIETVDLDDVSNQLKEKIESQIATYNDESYTRVAKYIENAEQLYNQYLQSNDKNEDDVSKVLRKLNNLEEEIPQIKQSNTFRLAKLKMLILDEDYEQIAQNVDDYSSYDELLVVSELYINGYIKNSNFSDELTSNKEQAYINVINQLGNVYDDKYQDEPKNVRKKAKELIDSIELQQKNIALATVKDNLASEIDKCDSDNTTKVYLQLSKVENYFNNSDKANEYIEKSMSTVDTCTDDNFSKPMYQVIGIMTTNDDPEKLKDVATYVDKIVTNTTTIQMADELTQSKNNSNKDDLEQKTQFNNYMSDYVSKKCVAINIIDIDKTNFPTINAKISFDSDLTIDENNIIEQLEVLDCSDKIDNYKIEKISYSKANILLCCDLSGSMSRDIDNLKSAVNMFIENKLPDENIAMLTFDDEIINTYQFGTSDNELIQATSIFHSDGGTDIYNAAIKSINMFGNDKDALNIIILMSDGQDNNKRDEQSIINVIGQECNNKNIQLYSLGLGYGVDSAYLSLMSDCTGGSYLYVNDSSSLETFYEYIHTQYTNQYTISYTAQDTLLNDRVLKVNMINDNTYDIKYYSLIDEENEDDNILNNGDTNISTIVGKSIKGLDTRLIYKSNNDSVVNLIGTGFKEDDKITAKIQASLTYDIPCKYINETTIELTIPSNVCADTYDLYITVGSDKAILDKELTVAVMGSEKTTEFGPYKFTSYAKVVDGNKITLTGNVCLNGWLTFNEQVVLEGDFSSSSINMIDNYGSRINYYEKTSQGFAKILAKNSTAINIPALFKVTLYNDTTHCIENGLYQDDYATKKIAVPVIVIKDLMYCEMPSLRLYPDRFVLDLDGFTTKLPMQDKLLGSTSTQIFKFSQKANDIVLTNKKIGCDIDIVVKNEDKVSNLITSNLGNVPIKLNPLNFEIKIDTIRNKYSLKFITNLDFAKLKSVGLSLQWWDNSNSYEQKSFVSKLVPYEVRLYANYNINTVIGGVPITFNDFELALNQINVDKPISQWCLEGKMSIEAVKVNAILPGLDKYIKNDVSVFSLKNATAKLRLNGSYIKLSTDFYMLNKIKLAQAEIEMGKFKYSNSWLNMYKEDVIGMRASYTKGIQWDTDNCKINITGSTELSVMNKLVGIYSIGKYNLNVQWWVLEKVIDQQGDVIIGFYTDHKDQINFIIFAHYFDRDSESKKIQIVWNKNSKVNITTENL